MSTSKNPEQRQKPQWHVKAGLLQAACWKSILKSDQGKDRDFHTVTIQRAYKDKDGKWQYSQSLRRQDLLPMARLLEKAYDKLSASSKADE